MDVAPGVVWVQIVIRFSISTFAEDNKLVLIVASENMSFLIDETPAASAWVESCLASLSENNLGRLASAVIWTDSHLVDGKPIGGADPSLLVNEINEQGLPLLRGHDPGLPVGRFMTAQAFTSPNGTQFVAAIAAYYEPRHLLSFASLGVDPFPSATSPSTLGSIAGYRIAFGTDPREVETQWLDEALEGAPLFVKRTELSHNAAESVKELIRVALPYAILLWNPLVTTVANEAGKDIYAAAKQWLHKLWNKLKDLRDPIVDIQAPYQGCTVSFLIRGRNVEQHYAAHAALAGAAAQAVKLIDSFGQQSPKFITLTYEYQESRWFPSYAIMADGRIVSDRSVLIAYEQLPKHLSLGLAMQDDKDQ
jgi:hypothetical protein